MRAALLMLTACMPDAPVGTGPTLGGDTRWAEAEQALRAGVLPAPDAFSEAGFLEAFPFPTADVPCAAATCLWPHVAELPDGTWLAAVGLEGAIAARGPEGSGLLERAPADVSFALDASCSVAGAADVRAAAVLLGLDHLDVGDGLAISAFRDRAATLLELRPADAEGVAWAEEAIVALDTLPELEAALNEAIRLLPDADPCGDPGALAAALEDCAISQEDPHPCGPPWDVGPDVEPEIAELRGADARFELDNAALGPALVALACGEGTDVAAGLEEAAASLSFGTTDRAARIVLVSDLQGAEDAVEVAEEAAARFVGLTLMALTQGVDRGAAAELARVPGALLLEAAEPELALATWAERFDLLVAPRLWSLRVEEARAVRGATDGVGAAAVFASRGHGVLGAVLEATEGPALLRLAAHTPEGPERLTLAVKAPVGAVETPFGRGESIPALQLAVRLALVDALSAEVGGEAGAVAGVLPDAEAFARRWADPTLLEAVELLRRLE